MVGIYVAQMGDAVPLRLGGEAGCSPGVGLAGVRVPDMGGEELDDAALGGGIGRQQGREPSLAAPRDRSRGDGTVGSQQVSGWIRGHWI